MAGRLSCGCQIQWEVDQAISPLIISKHKHPTLTDRLLVLL
ncbi:hypothetical protein DSBG_1296 [Desulfosporosinus sp. BG]|nr:hypothetical protein DSBG_1296 [Desulfosporosinus sp. BG]